MLCAGNQMVQYFHNRSLSLMSTRYLSKPSWKILLALVWMLNTPSVSLVGEAEAGAPYTQALMKYAGGSHTRGATRRLSKKTLAMVMATVFSFPNTKGNTQLYSMWDISPIKIPPYNTYARFRRASQSMLLLLLLIDSIWFCLSL